MTAPTWTCLGDTVSPGDVFHELPGWLVRVVSVDMGIAVVERVEWDPAALDYVVVSGRDAILADRLMDPRLFSRMGVAA